jgi:hypothetical protein
MFVQNGVSVNVFEVVAKFQKQLHESQQEVIFNATAISRVN